MTTTRTTLFARVLAIVASPLYGDGCELEAAVNRLRFWGAGVSTPRGLSDTGLPVDTLLALTSVNDVSHWFADELWAYVSAHWTHVVAS